jgi:hypothetical protein
MNVRLISIIKEMSMSKSSILAISLSAFTFLKDIQELITSFASHLLIISITLVILVILLIINFFYNQKTNRLNSPEYSPNFNDSRKPFKLISSTAFSRLLFSVGLFIVIVTIGSFFYIKNMGCYYVVIQKDLEKISAIRISESINESDEFVSNKLRSRIIPMPNTNNFEIILFNGYISKKQALSDSIKVKEMQLRISPYIIGPQKAPNWRKKIKYLQRGLF